MSRKTAFFTLGILLIIFMVMTNFIFFVHTPNIGKVLAQGNHDIAVVDLSVSSTVVAPGEEMIINVTVENQGDFNETFYILVSYGYQKYIGNETVTDLAVNTTTTKEFTWKTTGLDEKFYLITADAVVLSDVNPEDNEKKLKVDITTTPTKVYVDPPKIASVTWTLGKQFNVTVKVVDVVDLFAWQFKLGWNATVLEFINITEGDILETQPEGTFFAADTDQTKHLGWIGATATTIGEYEGVPAKIPKILAYVTFEVKEMGVSVLQLFDTILVDSKYKGTPEEGNLIPHMVTDGYFINVGVPEAIFTYLPSFPVVNEPVTFDASESYDTDGTIVSYLWDFGDGTTINGTDSIVTHNYTEVGNYMVNLTVKDDKALTNFLTATINVGFRHDVSVTGVSFDVFFVKSGESLTITVTVKNEGAEAETFDVTVYYGNVSIGTQTVSDLAPGSTEDLKFVWVTTGVALGEYNINAVATLDGDEDLGDNTKSGGDIKVEAAEHSFPMLYVVVGAIVAVFVVVLGLFFFKRRRG